jgi:hypothetical protein
MEFPCLSPSARRGEAVEQDVVDCRSKLVCTSVGANLAYSRPAARKGNALDFLGDWLSSVTVGGKLVMLHKQESSARAARYALTESVSTMGTRMVGQRS